MSNHSATVTQFWDAMNRHANARYRTISDDAVLEFERYHALPFRGAQERGRLVVWVRTNGIWENHADVFGTYTALGRVYDSIDYRDTPAQVARRLRALDTAT